jgi:ribosomal protein S18 acetylase RimI-like enzyme
MTASDWREASAADVERLLTAEVHAWRRSLDWDVAREWRVLEPARVSGVLPGVVVRDRHGRIAGWTWFLLHGESLQIGAIGAVDQTATASLIDAALASGEARRAVRVALCVRDAAPGLRAVLAARGFDLADYHYLCLADGSTAPAIPSPAHDGQRDRLWASADIPAAAALCARAYDASPGVRAFAPGGTAVEWHDYVSGLVVRASCGPLVDDASWVVPTGTEGELSGVIFTTRIAPRTAHVAQVAVDPGAQGQGIGRRLLGRAIAAARAQGLARATLLVSAANARAGALYAAVGFTNQASFVVGARAQRQPRRLTSEALDTGGASTRRYASSVVSPRSRLATTLRRASSASASADNDA